MQPADAERNGQPAAVLGQRRDQLGRDRPAVARPVALRGKDFRARSRRHRHIDALRHHRVATGFGLDIHAEQIPELVPQLRPRETARIVLGAGGQPADQVGAEPVVLPLVDGTEVAAGERTGHVQGMDDGVRIGRQGEDGRNAQPAGHRRGGHAADIGHPQVQHIDPAVRGQRAPDAPLGRHRHRPGVGGIHRRRQQRDRRQHVPDRRIGERVHRAADRPAGHRDDPADARLGGQ